MKKILLIFLTLGLLTNSVQAFIVDDAANSSGELTTDSTVLSGAGYFRQILIVPDGTNAVTVSVYDNTTSAGTKILPTMTFAGDGGPQVSPPVWISVNTGIRVDVTVAGGGTVAYAVMYRKQ